MPNCEGSVMTFASIRLFVEEVAAREICHRADQHGAPDRFADG
jgi:hypothetical protein